MKYCGKCGNELRDDQNFCNKCGTKVTLNGGTAGIFDEPTESSRGFVQQNYERSNWQGFDIPNQINQFPMKWYKFLIYFLLFATAITNFIMSINYFSGMIYEIQGIGTAYLVYSAYRVLRVIDVMYGIVMLGFAAFAIYTRFRLAKYRKDGPMCLYIMYGSNAIISILYSLCVLVIAGTGFAAFLGRAFGTLVGSGIMIALNYTYFNKRKSLFVN